MVRSQSGFYTVDVGGEALVAQVRGRLKHEAPRDEDLVAIGDWVQVSELGDGTGRIEEVEPRERLFYRMAPTARGEYRQIIVSNPDQAVIVFACALPAPRLGMLDRFLVTAEEAEVPARIVANKVDLVAMEEAQALFGIYAEIGYPLLYTSALTGQGVPELKAWLQGRVSVLMGPSGAGKSSLLNAVHPGLGLEVRAVSEATTKGRHTTVVRELFPLAGGYVADTPGLKAFALWDIEPQELDAYFPEIRPLVAECQFSDCTHLHEPGCAVRAAVQEGRVNVTRYESYLRMREGEEQEQDF